MTHALKPKSISECLKFFVGAAVAVLAVAGPSQAKDAKAITLQLDWLPSGYHAPIFLAQEKGYYKDAGITLTIVDGQGTNSALQAAASGNADIVLANYSTMVQSIANGMKLVGIGGLIQRLPDAIVSLASAPINSPKEMEGTIVTTTPESAGSKLLPAFMAAAGVDASKVTVLNTAPGQSTPALLSGGARSMTGWSFTDALVAASQKPIAKPILMSDYNINLLGTGFVTTKAFAAANPDALKAFMAATAKGYADGLAAPEKAIDAMIKERPMVAKPLPMAQLAAFPPFLHSARSEGKPFGWTAKEDWEQTQSLLKQYFSLKGDVDIATVYTNDFVAAQ